MEAQTNGGYGERYNVVYVMVAPQNYGSHVLTVNGNLIRTNNKLFWSESVLQSGYFIEFDGAVYRFSRDNEWIREGGYWNRLGFLGQSSEAGYFATRKVMRSRARFFTLVSPSLTDSRTTAW